MPNSRSPSPCTFLERLSLLSPHKEQENKYQRRIKSTVPLLTRKEAEKTRLTIYRKSLQDNRQPLSKTSLNQIQPKFTSSLSKRLNFKTKPKPRTVHESPLVRLSAQLVQTYIKINEHYFALEQSKRRNLTENKQERLYRIPQPELCDDSNDDYIVRKGEVWDGRFEVVKLLGRGSFGQVVEAIRKSDSERVAIKIIKNRQSFYNQAKVEIRVLEYLNKREKDDMCIVRMKEYFEHKQHLCIVFEMLSLNLYELLHATSFQGISLNLVRDFARQILTGLLYLKQVQVIHCDLKPENILLQNPNSNNVKIIDFGSSCFYQERAYTYIQSRFYRSPEIILGHPYSVAIDMWSLGCILVELLCGEPLFAGKNEHEQLCIICDILGEMPPKLLEQGSKSKVTRMCVKKEEYATSVGSSVEEYKLIPAKGFKPSGKSLSLIIEDKLKRVQRENKVSKSLHYNLHYNIDEDTEEEDYKFYLASIGETQSPTLTDYKLFEELIKRMLKYDPKERITPEEALQDPFFTPFVDLGCNTEYTCLMDSVSNQNTSNLSSNGCEGIFEMTEISYKYKHVGIQNNRKRR